MPRLQAQGVIVENFQAPLNSLNKGFRGFRGGHGLRYVGPHGCLITRIVTISSPKPQRRRKGFGKC